MKKQALTLWVLNFGLLLLICACTSESPKTNTPTSSDDPITTTTAKGAIEVVEHTDFEGVVERYSILKGSGKKHGKYLRISPDDVVLEEAFYKEDTLDGLRILYYPNRDTQIVETYQRGLFHGPYRNFYQGNHIQVEGVYINNQIEGVWFKYYPTGELMEEVHFSKNLENGPFKEYYKNGQLSVEGHYKDGDNEHGELKFYSEDGAHIKTMDCDRGMCRTIWKLEEPTI